MAKDEVGVIVSTEANKAKGLRGRFAAAAGSAALLALVVGVTSPASGIESAPAPAPDFLAGDELTPTIDVAAATKAAQAQLGDRYAGAWLDRSSGSAVLKVAVADAADLAGLASGRLAGTGVELVPAERSLVELEQARERALNALPVEISGPIAVEGDPRRGAVVVSGGALDSAAQARISRAAGIPVIFEDEDGIHAGLVREACFYCYPPWRAGLPIRSGKALCTGAFTVYQGKKRKHKFRALTAGHCQTNRRKVYVADRKVGKITANAFRGKRRIAADAMRFKIPRNQRRAQVATAQFGDVPVIAKLPNRAIVPYQYVCFSGRTTGGGCGFVGRQDIALRLQNKIFTHLWCAHVPTRPGDSGGSVVQARGDGTVKAVGIVDISLQTTTSDEVCFSSINLALKKTGTRLLSASR